MKKYFRGIHRISKSEKYKYVSLYENQKGKQLWKSDLINFKKGFETELEAAKYVDKGLISIGKEPVNVFKRKV